MEKKNSKCPLLACEKMFKAIASSSPFRRRISHYPRDPVSANHAPNSSSPPTSIPIAFIHDPPKHPKPVESAQRHKPPKNIQATEAAAPVKFRYPGLPTYAPVQTNGQVSNNIAPKMEPSVKTKPNMAKHGNTAISGQGQVVKVACRIEPEPPVVPQKNKTRTEKIPQVNRIESNNLGANADERFTDYINSANIKIRTTSANFRDGFNSRTTSIAGDGKIAVPGREDNSKDNFSDYINRAKLKMMRTVSSFGGGRSDSMK
ncbi:hypothetical protein Ddye_016683 [Dipteronia dyeriana]|uniref:Uncharacterized protein n=1 Tax=Dipteronia dyeriana TaxID=168575 RepID=A0AAD9U7T1_9ROSI|nr:hypothetical protein Ddye_016683 [Dipteronia dyeriana]